MHPSCGSRSPDHGRAVQKDSGLSFPSNRLAGALRRRPGRLFRPIFRLSYSLTDENPTFGETNGRFAVGRPVLLLVEPDEATSMAAAPSLRRKTCPSGSKD
jgi:hypothetical protein